MRREWPLVAGVVAGWALLVDRGRAFVLMHAPAGFDWSEYLQAAWMVVHRADHGYPAFRNPLYPWLLGALGEAVGSYPVAALLLASVGTFLVVLAAGVGARALASPWAGAVAALSVPFVHDTAVASRWVNLYPLLGGATGMGVALALCAWRWPRVGLALASGLLGGVAWGIDNRALPVVLASFVLVGLGAVGLGAVGPGAVGPGARGSEGGEGSRWGRGRWRFGGLAVAFSLGASVGPVATHVLAIAPSRPMVEQVRLQRENDLRGIVGSGVRTLAEACRDEPKYETPSWTALRRPCARALVAYNLEGLPHRLPFGMTWTLLLLPLCWLPAGRGWRGAVAGLVLTGVAVAPLAFLSAWTMLPDRYVLQFAAPIAMLVPVGVFRFLGTVVPGRVRFWAEAPAALALGLVVAFQVDHGRPPPPLNEDGRYRALAALLDTLHEVLGPDDVLLDCSARGIETALLPRMYHAPPPNLTGNDTIRCMAWLEAPERTSGRRWVVTGVRCPFPPSPPGSLEAADVSRCRSCFAVPGPSLDVRCPHGDRVGHCPVCRDATVPRDRWKLEKWYYSGYSCIDTLLLFRWRGDDSGRAGGSAGEE